MERLNAADREINEPVRRISYPTYFFLGTTIILALLLGINRINGTRTKKYDTSTVLSKIVHIQ
ncbi:MAG TPA: hypothetical protein DDZ57_09825, partial [Porphyromonadaceae bacterium]|nr:hypothetical protein [Porphyromonadaceae bacterium]